MDITIGHRPPRDGRVFRAVHSERHPLISSGALLEKYGFMVAKSLTARIFVAVRDDSPRWTGHGGQAIYTEVPQWNRIIIVLRGISRTAVSYFTVSPTEIVRRDGACTSTSAVNTVPRSAAR